MARILLIEDNAADAKALCETLETDGYSVERAETAQSGLARVQEEEFDAVVTDLMLPDPHDAWGFEIIKDVRSAKPHVPVILLTAHHSPEVTIEAMKLGAFDYLTKPHDPLQLLTVLGQAVAAHRAKPMAPAPPMGEKTALKGSSETIVGKSPVMQAVYKEIGRVATKPVPVLIRGAAGTGKELVARFIHRHSERGEHPLVLVDCANVDEAALEIELFGQETADGARVGRFDQANHGTIFLDEIGDLSLSTQARLVRALADNRIERLGGTDAIDIDVRILAATHQNLELAVQERRLREDLYWRLHDAVIRLPTLRERREDIAELVNYFIQRYGPQFNTTSSVITVEALDYLKEQPWPNNVRQLEAVVRQALLLARGFAITPEFISKSLLQTGLHRPSTDQTLEAYIGEALEKARRGELRDVQSAITQIVERELRRQALRLANGDETRVKEWLGGNHSAFGDLLNRASAAARKMGVELMRQMSTPRWRRVDSKSIQQQAGFEQFANALAHEVGASLGPIGNRLQALQKSLPEESPAQQQAVALRSEILRLDELVRSHLRLGRMADPKLVLMHAEPLFKEVRELLAAQCEGRGVELRIGAVDSTPFRGDANQLKQVLINLVKNASQAIVQKGTITLRARLDRASLQGVPTQAVALEVEDTGPGIPREIQDRLFDPFVSTKPDGSGLGLPISARIVDKHGGVLEFETQSGHGTIFRVLLPACPDQPAAAP